jgi:hypothetical protein
MSLNYSNQETSVTIGESVRDEDGRLAFGCADLAGRKKADQRTGTVFILQSTAPGDINDVSIAVKGIWRIIADYPLTGLHGTSHHDSRLPDCIRTPDNRCHTQLSLRQTRQERYGVEQGVFGRSSS